MSELGNKLRDARIEKGYTLNTLQQMTKIQKKYLQAIEEGNFEDMPGSFYLRAFVKQYADMVGLDGDALLLEYEDEIKVSNKDNLSQYQVESEPLPSRSQRYEAKEKNNLDTLIAYLPLAILVALIVAIMIALIVAINSFANQNVVTESESESIEIVSMLEPESAISSEESETTQATPVLGENDIRVGDQIMTLVSVPGEVTAYELHGPFSDYQFEFEGNSFVWVGAFEDGLITLDTTINSGETLVHEVRPDTQELRLTLGYPEGANFKVNGQIVEPVGQYLRESIIFRLGENVEPTEETTMALEIPQEEESSNQNYQGPQGLQSEEANE